MGLGVLLGTGLVLGTSAWALAWLGLELNLMSFLPFALSEESQKKSAMNYFVIQSCGSLLLLLGGLCYDQIASVLPMIVMGLILKMGMMPLHFWVPGVASVLKSVPLYFLLSWQKVAPLAILTFISLKMTWLVVFNAVAGALAMLSTASIPLLLVFSGMLQLAWMSSLGGGFLWYYMGLYFLSLGLVVWFMFRRSQDLAWALLNSGGLPPLTGFIIKLKALTRLRSAVSLILLASSGVALSSYSRFLVNSNYLSWMVHPSVILVSALGLV